MEVQLELDVKQNDLEFLLDMLRSVQGIPGTVVEIGSWKCGTSSVMAVVCPSRKVFAFDLFGGLPPGVSEEPWGYFAKTDWEEIKRNTAIFGNLKLIRGLHETTVPEFAKSAEPIALLFMDSDHYSSHKVSLEHLTPLIPPGGIMVFHDWYFPEVQQAIAETITVDEWEVFEGRELQGMGALRKK